MLGPDASRYILAGRGVPVARPFNLRWLLPTICKDDLRRWRAVWVCSWVVAAAGMVWWCWDLGIERAAAAAVLLLALPGVWGPQVVRPVGVDLPAMAVAIMAVACFDHGLWPVAVLLILVAASIKETSPVFAAVWAWHPIMLIGLIVPAVVWFVRKPQIDQVTAQPLLRRVYEHPVITALEAHRGRWRDAWLMVAPWGATLAALYRPSWQTLLILVLAYAQLLVATDTVRLLHTAAGPVMALAAAQVLPLQLLPLILIAHFFWWRKPEVI